MSKDIPGLFHCHIDLRGIGRDVEFKKSDIVGLEMSETLFDSAAGSNDLVAAGYNVLHQSGTNAGGSSCNEPDEWCHY